MKNGDSIPRLLESQLLALREPRDGLAEPALFRLVTLSRIDPADIGTPIRGRERLEEPPCGRLGFERALDIARQRRVQRASLANRIGTLPRRSIRAARGHQQPAFRERRVAAPIDVGPAAVRFSRRELDGVTRVVEATNEAV